MAVWRVEEKESDVNLALHAYHDAMTGAVDQVIICTNDTDLAPALEMIRNNTEVTIGLCNTTCREGEHPAGDLVAVAHWHLARINPTWLAESQLPRVVHGGKKPTIKPESW